MRKQRSPACRQPIWIGRPDPGDATHVIDETLLAVRQRPPLLYVIDQITPDLVAGDD